MRSADIKPGDRVYVRTPGGLTRLATVISAPEEGYVEVTYGDIDFVNVRRVVEKL